MIARRTALWIAVLLAARPIASAGAQEADLNQRVLGWLVGRYASPIVCDVGGRAARALREIEITPGPGDRIPPVGRIVFVDLDADAASRCTTDLGERAPDVRGSVTIRLQAASRPDTARRDFQAAIRRRQAFDFAVPSGRLLLRDVGSKQAQRVDFSRGRARVAPIHPGSDDARLLAEFPSPRKLVLELEARDGTALRLLVFLLPPR